MTKLKFFLRNYQFTERNFYALLIFYLSPLVFFPILFHLNGRFDWEGMEANYWAIYNTVRIFHEIPGNNPWIGGGMPLGTGTYGFSFGLFSILSIFFNPHVGLRVAVGIYYCLGIIGCFKLANYFKLPDNLKLKFSAYFLLSNSLAWHLYAGHIIFINILLLPLLIYFIFIFKKNIYSGFLFGIFFAIGCMDNIAYSMQYIVCVLISIFIITKTEEKKEFIFFIISALLTFSTLVFFTLLSLLPMIQDFSRASTGWNRYRIYDFFLFSALPFFKHLWGVSKGDLCTGVHEMGNYLGIAPMVFFIYQIHKKKYIYTLPFFFLLAFYSSDLWFLSFNYILKLLPTFEGHGCMARIRILSPFIFVCFFYYAYKKGDATKIVIFSKTIKYNTILTISVLEVFFSSFIVLVQSHTIQNFGDIHGYSQTFYNIESPLNNIRVDEYTKSNIGVLAFGYSNIPAMRKSIGIGNQEYKHEYTQNGKIIEPVYWSPNRVIFKSTDNRNCVDTNIQLSRAWSLNGELVYKNFKIYENNNVICAFPDKEGVVDLKWVRPYSKNALQINLTLLLITLGFLFYAFIKKSK